MARPARVRIRSRNPCTRARRRLLGWKVRLPLATAHSPYCVLRHACTRHTGIPMCQPHATHSVSSVNFCVLLVTGAVSGQKPVAAVSPTFGRLFEGTDAGSPGQTPAQHPCETPPKPRRHRPTINSGHTRPGRFGAGHFFAVHLPERSSRPLGNLLTCLPAPFRNWSRSRPRTEAAKGSGPRYRVTIWSVRSRVAGPDGPRGERAPHPHLWITVWIACHSMFRSGIHASRRRIRGMGH